MQSLPALNASLNSLSALLLLAGLYCIRHKRARLHRRFMLGACVTSLLFLVSYLTYHFFHGHTRFVGPSSARTFYLGVLFSHIFLAAVTVPLALLSLYRALGRQFGRHRRVARWTFPVWLYVSVTGIVIYLMLYQLYPQR